MDGPVCSLFLFDIWSGLVSPWRPPARSPADRARFCIGFQVGMLFVTHCLLLLASVCSLFWCFYWPMLLHAFPVDCKPLCLFVWVRRPYYRVCLSCFIVLFSSWRSPLVCFTVNRCVCFIVNRCVCFFSYFSPPDAVRGIYIYIYIYMYIYIYHGLLP